MRLLKASKLNAGDRVRFIGSAHLPNTFGVVLSVDRYGALVKLDSGMTAHFYHENLVVEGGLSDALFAEEEALR